MYEHFYIYSVLKLQDTQNNGYLPKKSMFTLVIVFIKNQKEFYRYQYKQDY